MIMKMDEFLEKNFEWPLSICGRLYIKIYNNRGQASISHSVKAITNTGKKERGSIGENHWENLKLRRSSKTGRAGQSGRLEIGKR